jgi:hypothetical protein
MIDRASEMLSTELGDDISEKTQTRRYDSYGTKKIVLENEIKEVDDVEYTLNN